jgi:BlaI family transcriptional regulator, penicillinase repressor
VKQSSYLSKREQEIMDLAYRRGRLTTSDATEMLSGEPSNSTVRTLLRILEEKGQLSHEVQDGRYIYIPTAPRNSAAQKALQSVIRTFFSGSVGDVVAALLSDEGTKMSNEELDRLQRMIDEARKEGQ